MDYAIEYSRFLAMIEGYSDAKWISDSAETKFTSGYVFTLRGGAEISKANYYCKINNGI